MKEKDFAEKFRPIASDRAAVVKLADEHIGKSHGPECEEFCRHIKMAIDQQPYDGANVIKVIDQYQGRSG